MASPAISRADKQKGQSYSRPSTITPSRSLPSSSLRRGHEASHEANGSSATPQAVTSSHLPIAMAFTTVWPDADKLNLPSSSTPSKTPDRRSVSDPERRIVAKKGLGPLKSIVAPSTPIRTISEGSMGKGKRKADDVDSTPPDHKKEQQKATFAVPEDPRTHRVSDRSTSSWAPSSYHRKRARLSTSTPLTTPPTSRQPSTSAHERRSTNNKDGSPPPSPPRSSSQHPRTPSYKSRFNSLPRRPGSAMSGRSIPISALVSPHAPSVSRSGSGMYYMRDPRKPRKVQATSWALHLGEKDPETGARDKDTRSPKQAWFFFLGFVLFPIWWFSAFTKVQKTRRLGGTDVEKAVALDDPQVEHDAKAWRLRCRIMSVISLFTYIPFIILVAIFARR